MVNPGAEKRPSPLKIWPTFFLKNPPLARGQNRDNGKGRSTTRPAFEVSGRDLSRRRVSVPVSIESVSPSEVIASFNFEIPDSDGKILTEDIITETIAKEINIPYVKIDPLKLDLDMVTSHIPRPFAQRHLIVPVEEKDGVLTVAIADPFDMEGIENLKRTTKIKFKLVLSSKSDILRIVREFYGFRHSMMAAQKEMGGGIDLSNLEQYVKLKGQGEIEATDQHVVNAVEYLLRYAYDQRASDIHIEPKRDKSVVRLRIDGVLHYIHTIPKAVHPSVVSRIKMLSRMDIAEKESRRTAA